MPKTEAPATIGSIVRCGMALCPPLPGDTDGKSTDAMIGTGYDGELARSERPASCGRQTPRRRGNAGTGHPRSCAGPPTSSSAGWKMRSTVPSKSRESASSGGAEQHSRMAVMAAGVHLARRAAGIGQASPLGDRQARPYRRGARCSLRPLPPFSQRTDDAGAEQFPSSPDSQAAPVRERRCRSVLTSSNSGSRGACADRAGWPRVHGT